MATHRFPEYPREDFLAYKDSIENAIHEVFAAGRYILGDQVSGFEHEFAEWIGARHAIGVASGSDAIELLLRAHEIGVGDSVAVPAHTAGACIGAIQRAGASPFLIDVDPQTFTVLPASLEEALELPDHGIRAVLAVHLYGHPAAMAELQAICEKHGLVLLEDAAQAHGATWAGKKAGALARGAAFSFYPTKNLGAIGDGGAITTNDGALAVRIRELRQHGWRERYVSSGPGVNSRLDELQASILRVKLRTLGAHQARRHSLADLYDEGLRNLPGITTPLIRHDCEHAFHLYVIRTSDRDALLEYLRSQGVPASVHYPAAIHQQPGYYSLRRTELPHTEGLIPEILSLPLHPYLPEESVNYTVDVIRHFLRA